jgi:glycine cleavage system H protein
VEELMEFPTDRLYSEHHLWVKMEGKTAEIGISDYAKEELGEVDYVDLPDIDADLSRERPFGTLETSKAITDLLAPISGVVIEFNESLAESPEMLTDDPYGDGWLIVVEPSDPDELDSLLKARDYRKLVEAADSD